MTGGSPHVRGLLSSAYLSACGRRFIPACAGKPAPCDRSARCPGVHHRPCGGGGVPSRSRCAFGRRSRCSTPRSHWTPTGAGCAGAAAGGPAVARRRRDARQRHARGRRLRRRRRGLAEADRLCRRRPGSWERRRPTWPRRRSSFWAPSCGESSSRGSPRRADASEAASPSPPRWFIRAPRFRAPRAQCWRPQPGRWRCPGPRSLRTRRP